MNRTEYTIQLQSVFNLCALIRGMKITKLLDAMRTADTVGPILDPSLWIAASGNLKWQREAVEAALKFQQTIEQIIDREKLNED